MTGQFMIPVGTLVIANEMDRPCGRLVCVIDGYHGTEYILRYLCDEIATYHTVQPSPTPVKDFGVEIAFDRKSYWVIRGAEDSRVEYRDGGIREWQDDPYCFGEPYLLRSPLPQYRAPKKKEVE